MYEARIKRDLVPDYSIKGAFPNRTVPPCNDENARIAEAFIKKELAAHKKYAEDAAQKARFGTSSSPQKADSTKASK
jgi:hypothetical protein